MAAHPTWRVRDSVCKPYICITTCRLLSEAAQVAHEFRDVPSLWQVRNAAQQQRNVAVAERVDNWIAQLSAKK